MLRPSAGWRRAAAGRQDRGGVRNTGRRNESEVVRYNKDGSLDPGFGNGGISVNPLGSESGGGVSEANSVAVRSDFFVDNFPLEFGFHTGFALARFDRDGSLDQDFGDGGTVFTDLIAVLCLGCCSDVVNDVVLQPNKSIVAAGTSFMRRSNDFALARYED